MAKKDLNPNLQKLGKRIRELRKNAGYSSYDAFAHENNINRSQYLRWEQGENLRFDSLMRIMEIHSISPEKFFEGWSK